MSHDKAPNLRNLTVLPLHLSPEKDDELMKVTEGRISTFAHDLVPDYLRTKPDPEAEQKMTGYETKAANLSYDSAHVRKCNLRLFKLFSNCYDFMARNLNLFLI